jgi:hypothetical protein
LDWLNGLVCTGYDCVLVSVHSDSHEGCSLADGRTRYFICYTDAADWPIFSQGKQSTFGFTEARKGPAARLVPGDVLICYLRGAMAWCGVLEVATPSAMPDGTTADRLAKYPIRVHVRPVIILPLFKAIPITDGDVWNGLSLTRGKTQSPGWNGKFRSDLAKLPDEDGEFLVNAVRARYDAPLGAEAGETSLESSQSEGDDREWVNRQIVARRGQRAFREKLMAAYGRRCAVSDCAVPDILEAAHVTRYLGGKSNHITNGVLLRADLHTLYDCGLLAFDPATRKVLLAPALAASEYVRFEGKSLRETSPPNDGPNRPAMQAHLDFVFLPTRKVGTINIEPGSKSGQAA